MNSFSKASSSALTYRIVSHVLFSPLWFLLYLTVIGSILLIVATITQSNQFPWMWLVLLLLLQVVWTIFTAWLEYNNLGYAFDEKGLQFKEGTFSLHTQTIPYSKISNASFTQSFFQRMFNVGNVVIDQEDSQSIFDHLDRTSAESILQAVTEHSNVQTVKNS